MRLLLGDRIDRYVGRGALGSWFAALVFMVLLFSLIDVLINLPQFLRSAEEHEVGIGTLLATLARAQFLALPIVFVTVAPFATVIAAMFTISAHFAANEITPILFCGRSLLRTVRPVVALAFFSACTMAACWEWLIPAVNEPLAAAQSELRGEEGTRDQRDLVVKLRSGVDQTIFINRYDHDHRHISGITLVDRGSGPNDVVTIVALAADWDDARADWRLTDGELRTPGTVTTQVWLGVPSATPDLLYRLGKEGQEIVQLSYSELLDLRALRPGRRDFELAFHSRITFPLANLVLLMLALPFAVSYERGRRVERVVFAILLCGAYLVTDLTCQTLGRSTIHPVLAAWLPTILFGAFGTVFFVGVRS